MTMIHIENRFPISMFPNMITEIDDVVVRQAYIHTCVTCAASEKRIWASV